MFEIFEAPKRKPIYGQPHEKIYSIIHIRKELCSRIL